MEIKIKTKPLSINDAWQGRRFKTKAYKEYEEYMLLALPKREEIDGILEVEYRFYLKNHALTDVDNLIKPLQDILNKKGYFKNDRKIYKFTAEKFASDENCIEVVIRQRT